MAVVRLAEIDAPEKRQPFGQRSRQHLADLCFEATASVRPVSRDRYGRTVGHVECRGTDASTAQVKAGMAWVFERYVLDRSLYAEQRKAQASKIGLWPDAEPVAPWDWRASTR